MNAINEAETILQSPDDYPSFFSRPACVLMSPEQYESLMEMLSDYLLMTEADQRLEVNDDSGNISHEDMMRQLGITREEMDATKVEIEA